MNAERGGPPQRVPILTEVVRLSQSDGVDIPVDGADNVAPAPPTWDVPAHAPQGEVAPVVSTEDAAPAFIPEVDPEHEMVERILADLQRQVDLMLEYRIREMLTPILARTTDAVVRDARQQLASSLREMVARAVAQELARHRAS